jgi:predicted component of type VI protein secretion system
MDNEVTLFASAGPLRGREFVLAGPGPCLLGRSRSCAIRLPFDATVSRHHCLVGADATGVWVQDLGSLNGTFVNGEKVGQRDPLRALEEVPCLASPPHPLHAGDEIEVGWNVFRVEINGTPADEADWDEPRWQPAPDPSHEEYADAVPA